MRYLLTFLLSVVFTATVCSQVTNAEYFIDTDPGYRNGTPITISEDQTISKDFEVALSSVNAGFHTIGLRAKDAQGRWSQTYLHSFYILNAPGTNVSAGEYFMDADPGYGNATVIPAAVGSDSTVKYLVPLSAYPLGFHTIGVRFKDSGGGWSQTYLHSFYIFNSPATTISAGEYFIDTDPGYGIATAIPAAIGSDSTVKYIVPLSAYAKGFHTIGIRYKDNTGVWSPTTLHAFYVEDNGAPVNIVSLQYYFTGNGATDSIYHYPIAVPSILVDLNFTADLSQLTADREYTLHIWAVNERAARSEVFMKKVKVCNGDPVKANFDFIPLGTQVSFIDSSTGVSKKYKWDFGDGEIDSVSNPVHNYAAGGNYNVKLIVSNFCNSDTVVKVVNVLSLQSVNATKGGNTGYVTIELKGSGFIKESVVTLKSNSTVIIAEKISVDQKGVALKASFNLFNQPVGTYNVQVETTKATDSIVSGFVIETGQNPKLIVEIIGRNAIRRDREQLYEIKVQNLANIDAYLVPVSLILPDSTNVKLDFEVLRIENIPGIKPFGEDTTDFYLKEIGRTIVPVLLPNISANSSASFMVRILTTSVNRSMELKAMVHNPLFTHSLSTVGGKTLADNKDVASKCFKVALDGAINIAGNFVGKKCVSSAFVETGSYIYSIVDFIRSSDSFKQESSTFKKVLSITSFVGGLEVLNSFENVVKTCFKEAAAEGFYKSVFKKTFSTILAGINLANTAIDLVTDCIIPAIPQLIQIVNSFDPNEKKGPKGNSIDNYNQGSAAFNYKIYFENKNTATAPAQEVIIIDTLDKSVFDLSTFQLQSFGFGDSSTYIPQGLAAYATNNLLKRTGKPDLSVRTDAKIDTATGILKWRFLSIDPQTRELIDDPLDGFLPPNITAPQGEGFISYSIQPKGSLPHGTQIKNKASIYFDNNAPIVTNEFLNTIDKQHPVSSVTGTPSEVYDTSFTVQWSGNDNGAGVRSYDVFYKVNNGEYQLWQYDVSLAQNTFTGKKDSVYSFFSIAKDHAGNKEPSKVTAERTVVIRAIDSLNKICPGANTSFLISNAGVGFSYQWQVSEGNDFADIQNNTVYSGSTTTQLNLTNPATIYSNYKYRCKITNGGTVYYSQVSTIKFENTWLGSVDSAWETAANWSCGVVPDANTAVVIPKVSTVTPVLNVNGTCKSITLSKESNVLIKAGVHLVITGK